MAKAAVRAELPRWAILAAVLGLVFLGFFLFNLSYFFPDPKPTEVPQKVQLSLDLSHGSNPGAPNTLVEFTDYQCPYCRAAVAVVRELEQQYGTQLNVVIANFPVSELHPFAEQTAEAAECARAQGSFREYHDLLFDNQENLDTEALLQYARTLNLDEGKFTNCLSSGEMRAVIEADVKAGLAAGVRGTPTFFANGYRIEGLQPSTSFSTVYGVQ